MCWIVQTVKVLVTSVILAYYGVHAQALIGPSPPDEAVLINTDHTLSCRRGPDGGTGFISWEHSVPGSIVRNTIFIGEDRQNPDTKYDNFAIDPDNLYDLKITDMAIEDEGIFYCRDLTITSSETSVVRDVEVAGETPIITPVSGDEVTVIDGETSNIVCTATGYRPAITIQWFHKKSGGQESQITEGVSESANPNGDLFDVESRVQYTAYKEYYKGELRCVTTGQRAAPSQDKTTILNVQYIPIVSLQYGDNTVICSSDANPPATSYLIYVNGTEYPPSCEAGQCTLDLEVQYDTDVRCNATNTIGTGTKEIVAVPGVIITTPTTPYNGPIGVDLSVSISAICTPMPPSDDVTIVIKADGIEIDRDSDIKLPNTGCVDVECIVSRGSSIARIHREVCSTSDASSTQGVSVAAVAVPLALIAAGSTAFAIILLWKLRKDLKKQPDGNDFGLVFRNTNQQDITAYASTAPQSYMDLDPRTRERIPEQSHQPETEPYEAVGNDADTKNRTYQELGQPARDNSQSKPYVNASVIDANRIRKGKRR